VQLALNLQLYSVATAALEPKAPILLPTMFNILALLLKLLLCHQPKLQFPPIPSVRISASRTPSSLSSLTNEVRAQKAATTKQDRANSKDILPTSSFGLDPRGKAQQQRTAELFTAQFVSSRTSASC
jgi:hypothetical protein